MPHRAISRSSISFGLVSIPVEIFPATVSNSIHFNLLHAKDNSRIQERIFCLAEDKQIDRNELVHSFQIRKGKYVSFSDEELKKLEAGAGHEIEIVQFILTPAYPAGLNKEEIAARAGYEANGGFNNALGRLRTLELVHGRGELRASDDLYDSRAA